MILRIQNYFKNVKPVTIDGTLYAIIAVTGFMATAFGGDEAYDLFSKTMLFWIKLANGCILAGATAIKMFRSTQYAEHQQNKDETSKTVTETKTVAVKTLPAVDLTLTQPKTE